MSQKKNKKRHPRSSANVKRQAVQEQIADEKDRSRKRMDPTARTLLLGDLVFLAVAELLYRGGLVSEFVSGCMTLIGVVLLILALWSQFGPGSRPKLR